MDAIGATDEEKAARVGVYLDGNPKAVVTAELRADPKATFETLSRKLKAAVQGTEKKERERALAMLSGYHWDYTKQSLFTLETLIIKWVMTGYPKLIEEGLQEVYIMAGTVFLNLVPKELASQLRDAASNWTAEEQTIQRYRQMAEDKCDNFNILPGLYDPRLELQDQEIQARERPGPVGDGQWSGDEVL